MMPYRCLFTAATLSFCAGVYAQPNTPTTDAGQYQPPITVVSQVDKYVVNDDYSYTETETRTIRLNSQVGVNQFSQIPLSYNPDLEQLEVVEAYTVKPDGKKIPVEQSAILDRQSAASADAPMFNSDRVKTVIFPDTAVGDTLSVTVKGESKPLFPDSFSVSEIFPPFYAVEHAQVSIDMPENMALYAEAAGMGNTEPQTKDGRTVWTWTLDNRAGVAPEPGMAMTLNTMPAVFATTLKDEQAAANAYLARAQDKVEVSEVIQKQADAITQGIDDKKEQAKAIYDWVSSNIRYVAVYFGAGGVVPHSAEEILGNRYGDCKDHVVILEALLAAKGIESEPVLVNAQAYYSMPKIAVMPGVFDHVITYLPAFDVYVDSTAEVATFGVLPPTELGKPALHINPVQAKRTTLPLSSPQNNTAHSEAEITLNADGTATGSASMTQSGSKDMQMRMIAANIPQGMEAQVAQHFLQLSGQSGSGRYQFGQPRDLDKPFTYQSEFDLRDVFDPESDGALRVPLGLGALNGIHANTFGPLTSINKRILPFVLNGGQIESVTHLHIPESITVDKLPKDADVENAFGSYRSHYEQQGQEITVTRTLTINQKAPVTPADEYPQLQALNDAVNKDLRRQLFYHVAE